MSATADPFGAMLTLLGMTGPREACQVCGRDTHATHDHLPIASLLEETEHEDPRIGRAEDIRDGYDDRGDDGREVW